MNIHFVKEDIQIPNRQNKRYSTMLIIREMQIKTTGRYYLTHIRMAIIKLTTMKNYRGKLGEKKPLYTVLLVGTIGWSTIMENSRKFPQRIKNRTTI